MNSSYTFSYPTTNSVWLPNEYLESILESFQPRRGDQTVLEIIGKTVYDDTVACLASLKGPAEQSPVPEDVIRPSRPRELPAAILPEENPAINHVAAPAPTRAIQYPPTDSYNSLSDYAQSFYSDVHTAKAPPPAPNVYQPSTYSELSANLAFLAEINRDPPVVYEDCMAPIDGSGFVYNTADACYSSPPPPPEVWNEVWPSDPRLPFHLSTSAYASTNPSPSSSTSASSPPRLLEHHSSPHQRRHKSLQKAVESLQAQAANAAEIKRKYASKSSAPGPTSPGQPASQVLKRLLDPKKHKVACHFCRERKIACGTPGEDARDRTCDQCHKRRLRCSYPSESRRGIRGIRPKNATKANWIQVPRTVQT